MYGLVRRSADNMDADGRIQVWVPSHDPDDILKHDSQFIGCDSVDHGLEVLRDRNPVPAEFKEKFGGSGTMIESAWCTGSVWINGVHHDRAVITADKPVIRKVKCESRYPRPARGLAEALVKTGGAIISPMSSTWSELSSSQTVNALRKDPAFAESDLSIRELKDGYYEVFADARKAAARRKGKQTRAARAARKAAEAVAKSKVDEALSEQRGRVYQSITKAALALWQSVPELAAIGTDTSDYVGYQWDYQTLIRFWPVVALHEKLTKKGLWRTFAEVDVLLDAYAAAGDAFDEKYQIRGRDRYEDQALARYREEVARLGRRRKREHRKRTAPSGAPSIPG